MQATKGRRGVPVEPNDYLVTLEEASTLSGRSPFILMGMAKRGEVRRARRGDSGWSYFLKSEMLELKQLR